MKELNESYKGKLWSEAVQLAFTAPFPEVAIQHLLMRVHQKSRIEVLEELLSKKWIAHNEREAIIPYTSGAVAPEHEMSAPVKVVDRRLQYVKVLDIEKLLMEAQEELNRGKKE